LPFENTYELQNVTTANALQPEAAAELGEDIGTLSMLIKLVL